MKVLWRADRAQEPRPGRFDAGGPPRQLRSPAGPAPSEGPHRADPRVSLTPAAPPNEGLTAIEAALDKARGHTSPLELQIRGPVEADPIDGIGTSTRNVIGRPPYVTPSVVKNGGRLALGEVRGDGFESRHVGEQIETQGIVGAVNGIGFFIQPAGAKSIDAAGGLLVRSRVQVSVGDVVSVRGRVIERRKEEAPYDRSVVELVQAEVKVSGNDTALLPPVTNIGRGGLPMPPADPRQATEYWRRLLGQRVTIEGGVAVSPSNQFGDVVIMPDSWQPEGAVRTREGGLTMPGGGFNHTAVSLKFRPHVGGIEGSCVGARFESIEGVVVYRAGAFQIEVSRPVRVTEAPRLSHGPTSLVGGRDALTIASVNALNLNPTERVRAQALAKQIVAVLCSPDIIALQEIQDNDGPNKSSVVDARQTFQMLIDAIKAAGGPEYKWFDIAPQNGADGGELGGNIRVGYLYRPERVSVDAGSVERIGEHDPAFTDSRKPLTARFDFGGRKLLMVNNHFASRRGSSPWTSALPEPLVGRAEQRIAQAAAVRDYVDRALAAQPKLDVVMVGDLNDFPGSATVQRLAAGGFHDLSQLVPPERRFDYNYRGTLQTLQSPIASPSLKDRVDIEFIHKAVFEPIDSSDHDPILLRVRYPAR